MSEMHVSKRKDRKQFIMKQGTPSYLFRSVSFLFSLMNAERKAATGLEIGSGDPIIIPADE